MRDATAVLLISDISGYTRFLTDRVIALRHREEIISELIEAMLDQATHPLTVNKLQGDALLAYAEFDPSNAGEVATSVLAQALALHRAFRETRAAVQLARRHCACEACATIHALGIKSFLHSGDIVIKQIRQFDEIAGEDVILIHRLLKNRVPEREFVLQTDAFRRHLPMARQTGLPHCERTDDTGDVDCWIVTAEAAE